MSLSANIYPNVLGNSCDRMYIILSAFELKSARNDIMAPRGYSKAAAPNSSRPPLDTSTGLDTTLRTSRRGGSLAQPRGTTVRTKGNLSLLVILGLSV